MDTNPASKLTKPRQLIYLDILPPLSKISLTPGTAYTAWIIIVDGFSKFASIQGILKMTTTAVIDAIKRYLSLYKNKYSSTDDSHFCYSDIERIKADAGTQFISSQFQTFCSQNHISLNIAPPDHQEANHGAERPWQTIKSIARTITVHSCLDDAFLYYAVQYACDIYNVLPLLGAITLQGTQSTPFELFYGQKPSVSHFRVFGCPCVIKTNTARFYDYDYDTFTFTTRCPT